MRGIPLQMNDDVSFEQSNSVAEATSTTRRATQLAQYMSEWIIPLKLFENKGSLFLSGNAFFQKQSRKKIPYM